MISVKRIFQEHKDEIDLFYDFLNEIISHDARLIIDPPINSIENIKLETVAVAKSTFILMLYNCIESTAVNCLNTILRGIEDDGCKYADLVDKLQLASLAAYDYNVRECDSKDKRNELLKQQNDFQIGLTVCHLKIKSLMGSSSQGNFSGSLDAREIKKLFGRLGIDLSTLSCDEMKLVKDCRNKLAHGEVSFEDYGRTLTIQYLRVCKNNTLLFLEGLINRVDDYLLNKRYRR